MNDPTMYSTRQFNDYSVCMPNAYNRYPNIMNDFLIRILKAFIHDLVAMVTTEWKSAYLLLVCDLVLSVLVFYLNWFETTNCTLKH